MAPAALPPAPAPVTCAENIALLHLLHSVPAPPSRNPFGPSPVSQEGYTLSLQRERSLTGTLAFLSNLQDGPENIPAVCVQECLQSRRLNVLLAVNKARPSDGSKMLQTLNSGFDRVFALLSKVVEDKDHSTVTEHDVFTEIISMCSERILCRLRFVPNSRKQQKQPIKSLLQDAMDAVQQLEQNATQDAGLLLLCKLFLEGAREVSKLLDAWIKYRMPVRLEELVEGFNRLWRTGDLQHLLVGSIPHTSMDPASRKNLLNIIGKVARYRQAARFLYRTAKKFPLIRDMKVVLVSLPPGAFEKIPRDQYLPSLASTLSRVDNTKGQAWDVSQICRVLKIDPSGAIEQFSQQARRTLKDGKIHAEIQLLFHCELQAFKLPPRVFCSSKDACFLCNTFIRVYGKVHTPRCHGRLYPGWRLPFSPKHNELERRFNTEMTNLVRNSLTTLLSRQKKTVYPDPHESTLLTIPMSLSTIVSLRLPDAEEIELPQLQTLDGPGKDGMLLSSSDSNLSSNSAEITSDSEGDSAVYQPEQEIAPQKPLSNSISLDSMLIDDYILLQGQILSKSIKPNHKSTLYEAGNLEVLFEYSPGMGQNTRDECPRKLHYSVEWLEIGEAEMALERNSSVHDVEVLEGEMPAIVDELGCFYITAGKSVLKIVLLPT